MARRKLPRAFSADVADVVLVSSEVVYDRDKGTLRVGDGVTPGGDILAKSSELSALGNSVKNAGVTGDGSTNDRAALLVGIGSGGNVSIPQGTYYLGSDATPAATDARVQIDPRAKFTNAELNMANLMPIIGASPSMAFDAIYKAVNSDYSGYYHVVGYSSFLRNTVSGVVTVGMYANSEAAVSGASAFGANFGCYVTAAGAKGIALEVDSHVTVAGAESYALAVDSVGTFPTTGGIIIQNNSAAATMDTALKFNNSGGNNLITAGGSVIAMNAGTVGKFIAAPLIKATLAEIDMPSLIVGPTQVTAATGVVRIDASTAGTPQISAVGSATNVNLFLKGKGTGGGSLIDGGSTVRFRWGTNGIGFHGTAPTAKPSITGSRATGAALTDLLTKVAATGLFTDSTTA